MVSTAVFKFRPLEVVPAYTPAGGMFPPNESVFPRTMGVRQLLAYTVTARYRASCQETAATHHSYGCEPLSLNFFTRNIVSLGTASGVWERAVLQPAIVICAPQILSPVSEQVSSVSSPSVEADVRVEPAGLHQAPAARRDRTR